MLTKRWAVDEHVPGAARASEVCRHYTAAAAHHCVRARMHADPEAISYVRGD